MDGALPSPLRDTPNDSQVVPHSGGGGGGSSNGGAGAELLYVGMASGAAGAAPTVGLYSVRLAAEAPPAAAPDAAVSERWCGVAAEEGVVLDAEVREKLRRMESVAAKAGVELAEASVRSFLRRCVITDVD